jgi:putative ABC transport system substrate-binding protein
MMDRRRFIGVGLTLIAAPASPQPAQQARRIAILDGGTFPRRDIAVELAALGWVEGRNLIIERRGAEGDARRARAFAAELVRLNVEVIVTFGAVASLAARDATNTIPTVARTGDPVLLGLVANLSHPGGNVTGTTTVSRELSAKRLEVLRSLLPNIAKVAEIIDPANEYVRRTRSEYEQAFHALDMQPIFVEVPAPTEMRRALEDISRQGAQALIVRADPVFLSNREQIIQLANQLALPTMTEGRQYVEAGALASYAPTSAEVRRQTAALVDRILRGAKPADLPIEQPTQFELVINLKTAKTLGVSVPPSVLQRADEVLQ